MTPFQAYVEYTAIKSHFAGRYDYFKYNGKLTIPNGSFAGRRDVGRFEKLAQHPDPSGLMLAVLSRDPQAWVGSIVSGEDAEEDYAEYVASTQSFSYAAPQQLDRLDADTLYDAMRGDPPIAFSALMTRKMTLEVAATVESVAPYACEWVSNADPLVSRLGTRIQRYAPFMLRRIGVKRIAVAVKKIYGEEGIRVSARINNEARKDDGVSPQSATTQ